MDGAAWNNSDGHITESAPSKLFCSFPVVFVTAHYKSSRKISQSSDYECPVYKYPVRTDKYKIFHIFLPTKDSKPQRWTLRGVALLCQTS
jgi:dynein heavy chain, axonemal